MRCRVACDNAVRQGDIAAIEAADAAARARRLVGFEGATVDDWTAVDVIEHAASAVVGPRSVGDIRDEGAVVQRWIAAVGIDQATATVSCDILSEDASRYVRAAVIDIEHSAPKDECQIFKLKITISPGFVRQ